LERLDDRFDLFHSCETPAHRAGTAEADRVSKCLVYDPSRIVPEAAFPAVGHGDRLEKTGIAGFVPVDSVIREAQP
ncbi:MAG: hypothetical protein KDE49_19665, partial [Novosphingobium sp.]|nr:hypothetical protein [Novosphingobium sp.]